MGCISDTYIILLISLTPELYILLEIEPEVEIMSTESHHIQNTHLNHYGNDGDPELNDALDEDMNEFSIIGDTRKNNNQEQFRKNKSTPYGTTKNQRRNIKGTKFTINIWCKK